VKSLDITLGGITTSIHVTSDQPPRWARAGDEPQSPSDVIRELFAEARAEGIPETSVMAPRVAYRVDNVPTEIPMTVLAWLIINR
jgi:predicted secreted protein